MDYNLLNTISNYLNYINTDLDKEKYNYEKFKEILQEISEALASRVVHKN